MADTLWGFPSLPLEVLAEILWQHLVTPEPVALAYSGRRFAVGGRFLLEEPRFFCVLQTCSLLRRLGRRLFLRHNTFVFGDFFFDSCRFYEGRRFGVWLWTDDRLCEHPRTQFCSHLHLDENHFGSPHRSSGIDVGGTLGYWLGLPALGHIKHLIIVHRHLDDDDENEPALVQSLLLVERLIRGGSKLASLFIFMEQPQSAPWSAPLVGDARLDLLARAWHFLPALAMLSERCPGLHLHISHFAHGPWMLHARPIGPVLCADAAASARSFLSARALGGRVDGGGLRPGLSLSIISPDTSFATSADGRYLLEFGQMQLHTWAVPGLEEGWVDVLRRTELRRAHLWHDHRGLLKLETPWLQYDLVDAGDDGQSASSMLRSLSAALQLRLSALPPRTWQQWWPGLMAAEVRCRLLDPDRPDNDYVFSEGDDLRTVVAEWASLGLEHVSETESEHENEHLRSFLLAKSLFDEGTACGQRRIFDFFHSA